MKTRYRTRADVRRELVDLQRRATMGDYERLGIADRFTLDCINAVVGAAVFMDEDPANLAREMSDGRLAHYIEHGVQYELDLDAPGPGREVLGELERVERWATDELGKIEANFARVVSALKHLRADLGMRSEAHRRAGVAYARGRARAIRMLENDGLIVRPEYEDPVPDNLSHSEFETELAGADIPK